MGRGGEREEGRAGSGPSLAVGSAALLNSGRLCAASDAGCCQPLSRHRWYLQMGRRTCGELPTRPDRVREERGGDPQSAVRSTAGGTAMTHRTNERALVNEASPKTHIIPQPTCNNNNVGLFNFGAAINITDNLKGIVSRNRIGRTRVARSGIRSPLNSAGHVTQAVTPPDGGQPAAPSTTGRVSTRETFCEPAASLECG